MSVRDSTGSTRDEVVVARLHALAPHLDGEPDPTFRATTRARLVAMAAVRTPEPEPVSPLRRLFARADDRADALAPARWRSRLTAGLAGAALAVTALATLVAVATGAAPGDPLYGLKRGTEQTQLALASDATRGQTLLGFARTRLHELEELTGAETTALPAAGAAAADGTVVLAAGADPALVLETLATMDQQTTEGAAWVSGRAVQTDDETLLDELAAWTADQAAGLAALRPDLPEATVDDLDSSLGLLSAVGTRTAALTESLACPQPAVAGSDDLGPRPAACAADQPAAPVAGEGDPSGAPVPDPGSTPGSTAASTTGPAAGDGSGSGTGNGTGSGSGTGSGTDGPTVPTGGVELPTGDPVITTPSLPTTPPSLTLPGTPSVGVNLPGTSSGSSGSQIIDVCVPPLIAC